MDKADFSKLVLKLMPANLSCELLNTGTIVIAVETIYDSDVVVLVAEYAGDICPLRLGASRLVYADVLMKAVWVASPTLVV